MLYYRLLFIVALLCAGLLIAPAAAQTDDAEPLPVGDPRHLLGLLRYVPATSQVMQAEISYGDLRAAEAARAGMPQYRSFAEYLQDSTDLPSRWLVSMPWSGYQSLLAVHRALMLDEAMTETLGFNFFDIDRSLEFSRPPTLGIVLQGRFDAEQIDAAYTARQYTRHDRDGYILWCGAVGCANGMQLNLANQNPANIFGGDLGREFPVALVEGDDVIISSADLRVVEASASGRRRSLADDVLFQAAVESLAGYGLLRSALLLPPGLLNPAAINLGTILQPGATAEQIAEAQAQVREAYGTLPPYGLAFFADMATPEEQTAIIGLVYLGRANAEAAAEVLLMRLASAESLVADRTWLSLLEWRGMTLPEVAFYQRATGNVTVLLLTFRYPAPLNDIEPLNDVEARMRLFRNEPAGLGYHLFRNAFLQRDLNWLAYDLGF